MNNLSQNSKLLLVGQALSFMGDYCVLPALLILSTYYEDYWVTSGVIVVRSIPMIFQPFLGVLVDRFNRVKIMLWTDIIRGLIFLGIVFLPKGEYAWIFLILLLLSYGSGVFFNPARLAVMSSLGDDIKHINTLFAKATTLFIIVGALFGAIFLFFGSVKMAVAFNVITYFISAIFISKMNVQPAVELNKSLKNVKISFKLGIKEILHNPFLLNAVFTMMTMALLWGVIYSYFPLVSKYIGDGEIGNFILTVSIGLGGFVGAHLVNKWGFNTNKGLAYFVVLSVISISLFTFSTNFILAFIAAIGFFVAMEYGEVLSKVKVQENSSNDIQGRIFAVSEALIGLFISVGSILINFANTFTIMILITITLLGLFIHTNIVNKIHLQKSKNVEL
ncbi:bacilysin biosynthesis protein BacE [Peribacillus muralis]|uniref:Bacilysin biosynthesis protein BacE n=1 Tax=Peribacillus muralis TaxID=264697 RepID=A0A1B3XTE0_9BACI|nr:MFS transporter [Peribacillus muralis]AOH56485.1 bacilysin biosynthesis protein BacE [Peribacillus muralis]